MIEQWLGPEVFRDGIRRYLADARVREHRDARPVGRAGGGEREAGPADHGAPGSSSRATRRSRSRSTARRSGSPNGGSRPSLPDDETTWPVPADRPPGHSRRGACRARARGGGGAHGPARAPRGAGGRERREPAFVRTFYDDELRGRLTARHARPHAGGTSEPRGRRVGGRRRGPRDRVVVPGRRGRVRRRDGAVGLADDHHRARAGATGSSTVRRASGSATTCAPSCGPALDRLGWDPRPEDGELDRELRGDLIRTLGVLGDDPETQAMAREAEALSRTAGGVDASVAAAAVEVVAFAGGEEAFEAFRARMQEAPTPQEQDRYRYALAAVPRPRPDGAAARARRVRGGPAAGRAVPARACRGEPGPRGDRRGTTSATTGTSCCRASRPPT